MGGREAILGELLAKAYFGILSAMATRVDPGHVAFLLSEEVAHAWHEPAGRGGCSRMATPPLRATTSKRCQACWWMARLSSTLCCFCGVRPGKP